MAALLNCFKQVWTSIVDAVGACCGKNKEAPTTTPVEISTGPDGEVNVTTLATEEISSGGGGTTHADLLGAELKYSSTGDAEQTTRDILATSMISSGGGGTTH